MIFHDRFINKSDPFRTNLPATKQANKKQENPGKYSQIIFRAKVAYIFQKLHQTAELSITKMAARSFASNRLVSFVDIQTHYVPSQDIVIEYRQKRKMASHPSDWIGVVVIDWQDLNECIYKQKVLAPNRKIKKDIKRTIRIPANSIQIVPNLRCQYEFVYVTVAGIVNGTSSTFTLGDQPPDYLCELGPFEMISSGNEANAQGDSVPTFIGPVPGSALFDSFYMVDEVADTPHDAVSVTMPTFDQEFLACDKPVTRDNVVMTSDEGQSRQITYDHVTLNSEATQGGKNSSSYNDFIIDMTGLSEQESEEMKESREEIQQLVPIYNQNRTMLAYKPFNLFEKVIDVNVDKSCLCDSTKTDMMLEALVHLLRDAPSPPMLHVMTPAMKETPPSCQTCSKRLRDVKITRSRLLKSRRDKKRLDEEIANMKLLVDNQETLLEEFAQQIKNLVHDKAQLTIVNDNFSDQNRKLTEQMNDQQQRLTDLKKLVKSYKAENKKLQDRIIGLEGELSSYEVVINLMEMEREMDEQYSEYLNMELADIREQYQSCEALLDDVMYTLNIYGYDRMIDANGRPIDLTNKFGNSFELYGWSMKKGRREELYSMNLAKQEQYIQNLTNEIKVAEQLLAEKDEIIRNLHDIQEDMNSRNKELVGKIEHLMYCLALAEEKEGALYSMLIQERRNNGHHRSPQQRAHDNETSQRYVQANRSVATSNTNMTKPISYQNKSTVTFSEKVREQINTSDRAAHSSVRKPFKKYSDAVKNTTRSCERGTTGDSDLFGAWMSPVQRAVTATQSAPPVAKIEEANDFCSKRQYNVITEAESASTTMRNSTLGGMPKRDNSEVLTGVELPELFKEPAVDMRQSVILEGGVLPKLYRQKEENVFQQDSSIFQGNVLRNLFKANASKHGISPRESSILADGVLQKLFDSDSESVSSRGSSVFEGYVLPALFRTSSEESIETIDEINLGPQQPAAQTTSQGLQHCLQDFLRMLDRALSMVFSNALDDTDDQTYEPLNEIIQSAIRNMNAEENTNDEEIIPLLSEYPITMPRENMGYERIEQKPDQSETTEMASGTRSQLVDSLVQSRRLSRKEKHDRKFAYSAEMGSSKRRMNKKNYRKKSYGSTFKCRL